MSKSSNNNNNNNNNDTTAAIHLLVSAFLETWCHQLLSVRRVYPSESFANSYFLGLQVKANRHPSVVEYITKAVEVAVPALISSSSSSSNNRVADEFSLEVVQEILDLSSTQEGSNVSSTTNQNISIRKEEEEVTTIVQDTTLSEELSMDDAYALSSKLFTPERKKTISSNKAPENIYHENNNRLGSQSTVSSMSTMFAAQHQNESQEAKGAINKCYQSSMQTEEEEESEVDDEKRRLHSPNTPSSGAVDSLRQQQPQQLPLRYTSIEVLERFSLSFSAPLEPKKSNEYDSSAACQRGRIADMEDGISSRNKKTRNRAARDQRMAETLSGLEHAFRHLILDLANVKRDRVTPSDSLSFKITLHVNDRQSVCPQIEKAFDSGSWFPCTAETKRLAGERRPRLPLYEVDVDDCKIRFHMQRKHKKPAIVSS